MTKWVLHWSWCVEMQFVPRSRVGWVAMRWYTSADLLVDITREQAIECASKLPRYGGRYAYRVRPYRPTPVP